MLAYAQLFSSSKNIGATLLEAIRDIIPSAVLHDGTIQAIHRSPRIDGTESLVLLAPYRHSFAPDAAINLCGMAFLMATAKHFRSSRFWARDLIFLVPGVSTQSSTDSTRALERWLAAYHGDSDLIDYAGSIQAAISIELFQKSYSSVPCNCSFSDAQVLVEGPNGLLPNLDLANTAVLLTRHRAAEPSLNSPTSLFNPILSKLPAYLQSVGQSMLMILRQAFGYPLYAHGPFLKYRIDAITMSFSASSFSADAETSDIDRENSYLFEKVELTFRSLNNILEHLHQSFFFYVMTSSESFVSIANYAAVVVIPAALLVLHGLFVLQHAPGSTSKSLACLFFVASINALILLAISYLPSWVRYITHVYRIRLCLCIQLV